MVQRIQRINASCTRCVHPEENTTHVLLCQGKVIIEYRKNALEELRIWIKSINN